MSALLVLQLNETLFTRTVRQQAYYGPLIVKSMGIWTRTRTARPPRRAGVNWQASIALTAALDNDKCGLVTARTDPRSGRPRVSMSSSSITRPWILAWRRESG